MTEQVGGFDGGGTAATDPDHLADAAEESLHGTGEAAILVPLAKTIPVYWQSSWRSAPFGGA